jgi:hypothetical protein
VPGTNVSRDRRQFRLPTTGDQHEGLNNPDVVYVLDPSGAVACDAITDPFGSPLYSPYGSNPCHTGATSSAVLYKNAPHHDACAGACLVELGSRDYKPTDGRFLQRNSSRVRSTPI